MIDSHQHLIEPNRFYYPWIAEAPQLADIFDLPRYHAESAKTAIQGSILVETDVAQEDQVAEANYFCELASDPSNHILGVIASCRPQDEGFTEHIERITCPKLVGVRRVLHVVEDLTSQTETFRKNIASLDDFNLCFDLCVRADQLPLAIKLVRATPHTRFVLDHCGNPPIENKAALQTWRDDIARLAVSHNVSCKVSGLANHLSGNRSNLETLRPILEHVAVHFGWSRLMFGGDWPVCLLAQTSLQSWAETAAALVDSESEETQRAFFTGNATRIYGLH
jgi:predicted TIM-barrel fold metal-dependent hydrolase